MAPKITVQIVLLQTTTLKLPERSECVKVVVRCRPMDAKESNAGYER